MLTEKYDFRITDQMTIPLRPHWIANDSYREKCKMLVLNRSKGEIHKVDFSKLTDYIKEGDVIFSRFPTPMTVTVIISSSTLYTSLYPAPRSLILY